MNATLPKRDFNKRMIVEKIQWDGEFKMPDFVNCFTKNLPVLIKTLSGLMGCDDLHIVGGDEIYWIYDIQRQKRVVTSIKNSDRYCTIPVDHPAKFNLYVYSKNTKKKISDHACQLQDLIPIINSYKEQNVFIECENNGKLHFQIGSEDGNQARFGLMEVLDMYDEKYLLGYPICANKINASSCGIPVYLDIELATAVDFIDHPPECFKSWMTSLYNIVKTFPRSTVKMCQEIIIFSKCPNDGLYEYINPVESKFGIEQIKSGLEDYSKVNPYVIQPPPRPLPDPQSLVTVRCVDLPEIPKRSPPAPPPMSKEEKNEIETANSSPEEMYECVTENTTPPQTSKSEPVHKVTEKKNSINLQKLVKVLPAMPNNKPCKTPPSLPTTPKLTKSPSPISDSSKGSLSSIPITTPLSADVKTFNIKDVQESLKLLKMSQYSQTFLDKQVDGELLSCMDVELLVNEFQLSRFEALKLTKFVNGWRPSQT